MVADLTMPGGLADVTDAPIDVPDLSALLSGLGSEGNDGDDDAAVEAAGAEPTETDEADAEAAAEGDGADADASQPIDFDAVLRHPEIRARIDAERRRDRKTWERNVDRDLGAYLEAATPEERQKAWDRLSAENRRIARRVVEARQAEAAAVTQQQTALTASQQLHAEMVGLLQQDDNYTLGQRLRDPEIARWWADMTAAKRRVGLPETASWDDLTARLELAAARQQQPPPSASDDDSRLEAAFERARADQQYRDLSEADWNAIDPDNFSGDVADRLLAMGGELARRQAAVVARKATAGARRLNAETTRLQQARVSSPPSVSGRAPGGQSAEAIAERFAADPTNPANQQAMDALMRRMGH